MSPRLREIVLAAGALALLIPFYDRLYVGLLQSADGRMGYDYSLNFPNLLTGYYWFLRNGLFSIPWFSPSQCGGVPFYADPQVGYFSLPQFLVFLMQPLTAVRIMFWMFAALGYLGTYALLRRSFGVSALAAALAAALFMFNGFYGTRMLVGHLTYHPFMLTSLLAWAVLPAPGAASGGHSIFRLALGTACVGYMFHAGMIHIIPMVLGAVAVVILIHAARFGSARLPWLLFAGSVAGGCALAAGKIAASAAFLAQFPRDFYRLPGFSSLSGAVLEAFRAVFLQLPAGAIPVVNQSFMIGNDEADCGLSPAPLLLMALWAAWYARRRFRGGQETRLRTETVVTLLGIVALLALPILFNWYEPGWNLLLKKIPFIASSSNLVRWFSLYILPTIVAGALALDGLPRGRFRNAAAGSALIVMLSWFGLTDGASLHGDLYDPTSIGTAYEDAAVSGSVPPIAAIYVVISENGRALLSSPNRNDVMISGWSQLFCYEPVFGYHEERFPLNSLHVGPIFEPGKSVINLKNPACYVFPRENGCSPGDHFSADDRARAEQFRQYLPFPFDRPFYARLCDWLSGATLGLLVLLAGLWGWRSVIGP